MVARIIAGRPATASEVLDAARIAAMSERQLTTVRAAASSWRNGVGAASALVLATTVIAAPEVLDTATLQAKYDGGWLLALGALCTVISLALSMLASFGWPRPIDVATPGSLRTWEQRACTRARWQLNWSMVFALASFALFGTAIAVLVFGVPFPLSFPGWTVAP